MIDESDESVDMPVDVFNTGWVNSPTVKDLQQDYTEAEPDHDIQVNKVKAWLDNLNVTGKAARKKIEGRSNHVPKLIRKQAEWRYAALSEPFLSTDDIFNTEPVTYEDKNASEQNGLVLNNQFNTKLNKTKFIDEYVRTVVDEGTVIVRVGWDYQYDLVNTLVPQFEYVPSNNPGVLQRYQQIAQVLQSNNPAEIEKIPAEMQQAIMLSQQNGMPVVPVKVGEIEEQQTNIIINQPTLDVCKYTDIIVDPTCNGDIDKANFIIYDFETSLSELQKDKRYKNLDKINIENNSAESDVDATYDIGEDTTFTFSDKPRKKFIAHEYWGYWDINDSGIVEPFVATWVGSTLIRLEANPFPDKKLPFVIAQYLPVRKSVYGEPDGELLEENQKIVGAVTRGMLDIMGRSANGQIGSRKDALDLANKRKFDKGVDYEFNAQTDPRQAFHMHTYPEIPQSAGTMLQLQNQEAESLTGVKAFSQGISSQSLGDSVGGIKSAMDATAKREMGILRRLSEGMVQIGRKIIAMNAEFLSEKETVRVTNSNFIDIRRDDLAGNIDLTLSISTPEADNDKAKELAFMLQTMGNNQDPAITKMLQIEIARLRKMPSLVKQLQDYEPKPDPIEQKKRELEVQMLQAEIAKVQSETQENQAEAQLDMAKVRQTNSAADKQDLDYVEQETGTAHVRDVDRIQSQAEANTKMKLIENLTAPKKDTNSKA